MGGMMDPDAVWKMLCESLQDLKKDPDHKATRQHVIDCLDVLALHLLLEPVGDRVHVELLEDQPTVLSHGNQKPRALVDADGIADGLGNDDSASAVDGYHFCHEQ